MFAGVKIVPLLYISNDNNNGLKITKMIELPNTFERLTDNEAVSLNDLMRAKHGNVKACCEKTGLNVFTLNRARNGLDITKKSAKIIRKKLLSAQPVSA